MKTQILVTIVEISVWFSWTVDLYMFNFRFCLAAVCRVMTARWTKRKSDV